jgi:hypothetical protein
MTWGGAPGGDDEVQKLAVDMALMPMIDCTSLKPTLVLDTDGRVELQAMIEARACRMDYVFAHMKTSPVPSVQMVDVLHIYGTDLETGEPRTEVIVPPPTAFATAIGMFLS